MSGDAFEESADVRQRPIPLKPEPGESLRGFVVRLAEQELCSSDDMRDWLGLERATKGELRVSQKASVLLGIEKSQLERMGADTSSGSWVAGSHVPSNMVGRRRMRICPACLADEPFHRGIWELDVIDACPRHRVKLIDRCPSRTCGKLLSWTRWSSARCDCGADLSQAMALPATGTNMGIALLYRRFDIAVDGVELPEPFRTLPIRELLEVMAFLGKADLVHAQGNQLGLRGRNAKRDVRVLDAAAVIIIGWPEAFYELAERVAAARPHLSGSRVLNPVHSFIARNASRPLGPILQQAYNRFLLLNRGITDVRLLNRLAGPMSATEFIERTKVRRILGLSPKPIAALKKHPLWASIEAASEWSGTYKVYPRQPIEMLAARLSGLISFREADRLLGLTERETGGKISQLVDGGLLDAVPFDPSDGVRRSTVDRGAVGALLRAIERKHSKVRPAEPLTFKEALQIVAKQCGPKIALFLLFKFLIAGKLRGFVCFDDEVGVKQLTVERGDVDRAILDVIARRSR